MRLTAPTSRSKEGQVDEVKAEALGHHAGELVATQDPAFDQDQAGRATLFAGGLDGVLDGLAVG